MKRALKTEGRSFQTYLALVLAVFLTDFFFLGIRTVSPLPKPTVSPAVAALRRGGGGGAGTLLGGGGGATLRGGGGAAALVTFF
tara:strand:- start:17740 stop:17991 length:252 start_codon:yes stop_codon:yes gene_type:complete